MFRTFPLAATLIAMLPIASVPLQSAQSQAPRAKAVNVFSTSRSYLGIGVVDVSDEKAKAVGLKEPQGVEVTAVSEDSPASKAGISRGDIILDYNSQRVEGGAQFVRMVQETPVGRKAELQLWRNGGKQTITAVIGARTERQMTIAVPNVPMPPMPPMSVMIPDTPHDMFSWRSTVLGVETESLNPQLAEFFGVKEGVLVRSINKGSAAETSGLKAGDVITKVDGQPISSPRNITSLLRGKSEKNVSLTIVRNHKEMTLNVKISWNSGDLEDFPFRSTREQPREIL